jgi:uncharacterized membrane protein
MFDTFITIVVLVLLAFPVLAIVALVIAVQARDLARRQDVRLNELGVRLAYLGTPGPPQPMPAPISLPAEPPPLEQVLQPELPPQPEPVQAATSAAAAATSVPPISGTPPTPPPRQLGFEERFGTRWMVWIGGVALALGGIYLVRYSIEQGLIGPGVRVFLGGLLALALVAVGEWARRTEKLSGFPGLPTAHIPSILTAAGTTVAYATVYAAYGLYGFLPPAVAFILLGLVALLTLAAALLHGPALAGLGLVGAYVAPMLVSSNEPDYWALYIYLAVVTAAAFTLARFRLWRWLAVTAIVASALWTFPGTDVDPVQALGAHVFHGLVGFVLASLLIVSGLFYGPPAEPGRIDRTSTLALSVFLLVSALLVLASMHDTVALSAFVALTVATVAILWVAESAAGAVAVAAILAAMVMAHWAIDMNVGLLLAPSGPTAAAVPEPERFAYGSHLALGFAWAAMFGLAGFFAQGRSTHAIVPMLWSASGVFAPLAILIALYYRIYHFEQSLPFAALALLLAGLYGYATEALMKREPRPGLMASGAIFATGALAALALAFTFALEKGWLTVALALMAPGAAWIAEKRPLPWLRWLAAIVVVVVVARIGYEPRIVGTDVGTAPLFNWLLYGYGIPAAAFWLAGWLLRKRADDLPSRMVDAGAVLFTVLLAIVEIRHYVNGGDIYRPSAGITEHILYINVGLALTIGLERVRGRTGSVVHNIAALLVAAVTLCLIVFSLGIVMGPRFNTTPVGGLFFNLILLGYGIPAVLSIVLALIARTTRPMPYRAIAAVTAVTLALFYLSLEVRRFFHGPILGGAVSDAEQYSYSTVWLAYGVVLLAAGFFLRSQPARLAALAVIALTIAKVFIIDTASISGIYRAISVIGLGVVLLGIGWLYQRMLYPRQQPASAVPPASS